MSKLQSFVPKLWSFVPKLWSIVYGAGVFLLLVAPIIVGAIFGWNLFLGFVITSYGISNMLHYTIQLVAAHLNHRRMATYELRSHVHDDKILDLEDDPKVEDLREIARHYDDQMSRTYDKTYGILVVGHREDPHYFRVCLQRILRILMEDAACSTVFIMIDGNEPEDDYMLEIARQVFVDTNFGSWKLDQPLHDDRLNLLQSILRTKVICIAQPQRGKRHAMYTALWAAIQMRMPYLLVTDSDTWIDVHAPYYLKTLLDENEDVAATTGSVKIYNISNLLSFLIDLKYWFAFNLERAAQSHFSCVSCVSGPLGMYRLQAVAPVLEEWINQTFLCQPATFGDDRHMTNLILREGGKVLYTHKAFCYTETPDSLSRWFTQQTRWGRSFFREYLISIKSFYKISWWLVYDMTYLTFYSLFLFVFALIMFLDLSIPSLFVIITTSIVVAFARALYAILLERDIKYAFFAFFGIIYFTFLLPLKIWAALSLWFNNWGTSSRLVKTRRWCEVWPVFLWNAFLLACIVQSALTTESREFTEFTTSWICIGIIVLTFVSSSFLMLYMIRCRRIYKTQALVESSDNRSHAVALPSVGGSV